MQAQQKLSRMVGPYKRVGVVGVQGFSYLIPGSSGEDADADTTHFQITGKIGTCV